jgi:3-hydroxybutyryl-CoA dehydrogenase
MAEVCRHRGRVVGSHFILPAHILPLVEVIKHPDVDESIVKRTRDGWEKMGKKPIVVNVDILGFVANRLQHSLTRQAIELLAGGVASAEDIDNAVRFGFGARFTSVGPLGGRDLGGIINHSKVAAYLYGDLDGNGDLGAETLAGMAEQGHDGVKTLKGFYDWEGDPAELRDFHYEQMILQTKRALEIGSVRVKT